MYKRDISEAPDTPVKNGKPVFGSFFGKFKKFDIRGLKAPFGNLPIPTFITNKRIYEAMRFLFYDDSVIGEISFFSSFIFSCMETVFWVRKTSQKYIYRQYLPGGFIHIPKHISYGITACRKNKRYAKIFSRFSHGKLHADFDFAPNGSRPACEGRMDLNTLNFNYLSFSCVVPYRLSRRCHTLYMQGGSINGWISLGYNDDILLNPATSIGLVDIRKAYAGFRTKRTIMTGIGKVDNKILIFQLSSSISPDNYKHNENVMFYSENRTLLPPVKITRPYGFMGKWIIQDTESMVDLVFIPISSNYKKLNTLIFRTEHNTIYGNFEGVILTSAGKEIKLKNFPGVVKKANMRI